MPVRGAVPKTDRSQVVHRNGTAHDWIEIENIPYEGGPELRPRETGGGALGEAVPGVTPVWPASTIGWWNDLRRMPHAARWTPAEWRFAMDTAEIHARTMEGWRGYAGQSLTAREKQMGVTEDFRRGLRIRYVDPKPKDDKPAPANVTRLDQYRGL